jgi:hypothetical protein
LAKLWKCVIIQSFIFHMNFCFWCKNAHFDRTEEIQIKKGTYLGLISRIFYAPVSKDRGHIVFGLSICLSVCKNLNIGYIFWMASDRAFIFHMCVPYNKTFLLVPKCLTLWPWSLTHFSKTLTLAISFEWQVMGLSYFICVFLTTRPFYWYQNVWPCDLEVWPTFQKLSLRKYLLNGKW